MATGAVEAMIVDVQCIMPSLSQLCKNFHTLLITTSAKGQDRGGQTRRFSIPKMPSRRPKRSSRRPS